MKEQKDKKQEVLPFGKDLGWAKGRKKILLIGLGITTAGVLGYFGWQYWKARKRRKEEELEENMPLPPSKNTFIPDIFSQQKGNDDFPLKKGSKGARVKSLQEALIAKYGSNILPKYGADGDFGNETVAALKKANLPESIDESTFNVLVKTASVNSKELSNTLHKAATSKDINAVIAALKKMKGKEDYSSVSNEFKKLPLRGVSQTLVNGILGSFSDESQKQQIRLEFLRMGLKYDGNKWSLSGIDGFTIITTEPTKVWRTPGEGAKVPARMILGTEIAQRGDWTLFENDGRKFLVMTSCIKYL